MKTLIQAVNQYELGQGRPALPGKEEAVNRTTYKQLLEGIMAFYGVRVLFGMGISSAFLAILGWAVYGIPIILASIIIMHAFSRKFLQILYNNVEPTRKVRWHANSAINVFWTAPLWLILPTASIIFFTAFAIIPYGLYQILSSDSTGYTMDMNKVNLFFIIYGDALRNSAGLMDFLHRVFWWDPAHTMLSTCKIIGMPMTAYGLFYTASPHFFFDAQEFLDGEDNFWLEYENRNGRNT